MADPNPRRTGKSVKSPTVHEIAEVRERQRKAVELALTGMSLDQIAEQLEYADKSGAWRAINSTLNRQEAAAVKDMRILENARLDRLQTVLWPLALEGDLKAVDRLLRLFERRARLNGLDQQASRDAGALADALLGDADARRERLTALRDEIAEKRAQREAEAAGQ